MDRKVCIVTGASSGIGWHTALEFARSGYAVVLAARRQERLEQLAHQCRQAGAEAVVAPTDVSKQEQVDSLVQQAVDTFGRVDVMVNNAGFGLNARVHETSDQQMRDILDVNFFGVFYGCRAVAPVMMRQRRGHIFNVSSVIGKRGTPFHGAYCATKFAIIGIGDAMRVEMMPYNVRLTSVCPALTDTEFFNRSSLTRSDKFKWSRLRGLTPPRKVARAMLRATFKNKPEIVFTTGGKLLVLISAISPRLADRMMRVYHDALVRGDAE